MHDSLTIANRFLEIATEKGDTLTPMQLLKLVYIAHGWMLGLYGVPLIVDEVQAWKYGPVIPSLYKAISKNRDQPVRGPLSCQRQEQLVEVENSLIKQVFDIYGSRSVRWCRFLRQGHKVDRPMKRTIRYEDTQTIYG